MILEAWRPDTNQRAKQKPEAFNISRDNVDIYSLLSDNKATDKATAEAWLKWINSEYVYNYRTDHWYKWNGKFWELDQVEEHKASLLDFAKDLKIRAMEEPERDRQNRIIKIAIDLENAKTWKGHFEASAVLNNRIGFNLNSDLINLQNGTFDIKKMQFKQHCKEEYFNYSLPFDYLPEKSCPTWISFLNDIFLDNSDLIHYINKAVGYSLTAEVQEQCLFFLYGSGQNGKSVFIETLLHIFGDFGIKIPLTALLYNKNNNESSQREIIRLKNKRFTVANETEENGHLSESIIKDLTGGDTLTGRELYEKTAEFKATHKLWIYGNHKPMIKGSDLGIWRRIKLIPFLYTVPKDKIDRELQSKLKNELSGIFNWILEGLKLWKKEGLEPIPEEITNATAEYKNEMDIIQQFITDCCNIAEGLECNSKDLYKSFTNWLEESGIKSRISKNMLTKKLAEKDFDNYRGGKNVLFWLNIGLKNDL
ncbi:MAG: hypothetical protein JXR69_06950 [Candidatus Delongbacteria bacterium]|nr:hypothetical protein [Candidatus Delongbacteria bacterium]